MDAEIRQAIGDKKLVEFSFQNFIRIAEPHAYGSMGGVDHIISTQKFHSINDMVGGFGTEREAVDFALKAGKAWIDLQPPVPPCRDP